MPKLNTKIKCHLGHCEHKTENQGYDSHEEGICWKITQEEFKDQPTEAKYCPCKKQNDFIRRYARLGYMERGEHDIMITRPCDGCGIDFLFSINVRVCSACEVLRYGKQMTLEKNPLSAEDFRREYECKFIT